jgi:hypothetical protein
VYTEKVVSVFRRRLEAAKATQALLERVGVSSADAAQYEKTMEWLREEIAMTEKSLPSCVSDKAN